MRRRVDIACGLVIRPEVVFLDEPTTGLDPRSRQGVWSLVSALKEQGITILLTTQYLEEADLLSDNIVVIDKGTVIAEGTADELKARTGGSYCEVVPVSLDDLPRVREILTSLCPPGRVIEEGTDRLSIPAEHGAQTLPRFFADSTSPGSHSPTSPCGARPSTTCSSHLPATSASTRACRRDGARPARIRAHPRR